MTVARNAGLILAALLIALALFQLALAIGAPWGRAAFGGFAEKPGPSLRVAAAIATAIWSGAALIVLRRAGFDTWAPLPVAWLPVAVWVVTALLAVSIIVNALSPSVLEKAIWVPFGIITTALAVTVALASTTSEAPPV